MLELIAKAFILGVVVAIPVGPVSIAAARRAITFGFLPAFFFNLGSLFSDGFYILLVYVGLAPLLSESELLRLVLWVAGGAWLCWLGWEAIRTRIEASDLAGEVEQEPRWRSFSSGIMITLLNPLTIVSWIALAGSFYASWSDHYPPQEQAGLLALVVILLGVLVWTGAVAYLLSSIRRFIQPSALRWISAGAGIILVLFGLSAWVSALRILL